jgi:hypothetical protein
MPMATGKLSLDTSMDEHPKRKLVIEQAGFLRKCGKLLILSGEEKIPLLL